MDHLTAKLIACREYLVRFGVRGWPDRMKKLAESSQSSYERAKTVNSWCGGMGSLNDLFICPDNGHQVANKEIDEVNSQLMHLSGDLFKVANAIIKSQERRRQ